MGEEEGPMTERPPRRRHASRLTRDERPGPEAVETERLDRRRWLALVVLLVAGFMDLLDTTIVNVAIPSILEDLNAEYRHVEWVVAGYVLGFAALLVTGGRLGDVYGRRRMFLIGVVGFTVTSALCGTSVEAGMLIGARFLQGTMAGLMVPQILAIIHATFPAHERGKVLGIWGGVLGSASVAGLILGGVLVEWDLFGWGWRSIFLVNVPVGIVAVVAARVLVHESRSPTASKLDPIGAVLAIVAVLTLVYPLTEGRSLGWPWWTFILMASSLLVLAVFVGYERRRTRTSRSPLVVLRLFRSRSFTAGMLAWLIFWISLGGFFLVWTLYMQVGLGWTPLRAGLTSVAFAVGGAAGAGMSVQVLTPRFGRRVLLAGALLNAAGFAAYAWAAHHFGPQISSWQMAWPLVLSGYGFGLVVAPMVDAILTDVPVRDAGSGSGLLSTTQQVGMALGVALVGVLFFTQLDHDSGRGVDVVTPSLRQQLTAAGVPTQSQQELIEGFRACVRERSAATDPTEVPNSCQIPDQQPETIQLQLLLSDAGRQANAHNFSRTFSLTLWYAIGLLIAVCLGVLALPRQVRDARVLDAELAALEKRQWADRW
jgi:EmrB/QacA subfamily drug resistance transporter